MTTGPLWRQDPPVTSHIADWISPTRSESIAQYALDNDSKLTKLFQAGIEVEDLPTGSALPRPHTRVRCAAIFPATHSNLAVVKARKTVHQTSKAHNEVPTSIQ